MTGNEPANLPPRENARALRILFLALLGGVLFFVIIAIGINNLNGPLLQGTKDAETIFIWLVVIIGIICLLLGIQSYRKGIQLAKNLTGPLNNKLINYRLVLIKYLALCEFASIVSVAAYLITGEAGLLLVTAVMIIAMFSVAPTTRKIASELDLDWKQRKEIE